MNFDKHIGARLKITREKAGYKSAKSFSSLHNIPYITYSQHESGRRRINTDAILRYAELLSVSAAWLLTGKENTSICSEEAEHSSLAEENTSILSSQNMSNEIDANFLADVFEGVSEMMNTLEKAIPDRDKILLSVELYVALTSTNTSLQSKKNNLRILINSIVKIKSKNAA